MTKFFRLRTKTYSCLIDDGSEDQKAKVAKESVMKRELKFENLKNSLGATKLENEINHLEKNKINLYSPKKPWRIYKKQ